MTYEELRQVGFPPHECEYIITKINKARVEERAKALKELRESIMNCPFDYSVKIALDILIKRQLKEQKNE